MKQFTRLSVFVLIVLGSFAFIWKAAAPYASEYFPANKLLKYESTFGECYTKFYQENDVIISASVSEKFKYRQTFIAKDNGVYIKETYQYLRILKMFNKEVTVTYEKPVLRFPLPLTPGQEWKSEGVQYEGGEKSTIKLNGKCLGKEFVQTKAGKYEALKIQTSIVCSNGSKNSVTEWYVKDIGLVKAKILIEGGGLTGTVRDLLGYGTIEFNLKEINK